MLYIIFWARPSAQSCQIFWILLQEENVSPRRLKIDQSGHTHLKCVIHYSPSHESKQSQRSQLERSAWHTKNVLHQSSVKWNPKIWKGLLSVWCVSEQDLLLGLCYKMICALVVFINRLFAVLGTLSFTTFRLGQICN